MSSFDVCMYVYMFVCMFSVSYSRLETKISAFAVLFEVNKGCPSSIYGTASLNA